MIQRHRSELTQVAAATQKERDAAFARQHHDTVRAPEERAVRCHRRAVEAEVNGHREVVHFGLRSARRCEWSLSSRRRRVVAAAASLLMQVDSQTSSFSYGLSCGETYLEDGDLRPGFYTELWYEFCEHTGLAHGAFFEKLSNARTCTFFRDVHVSFLFFVRNEAPHESFIT